MGELVGIAQLVEQRQVAKWGLRAQVYAMQGSNPAPDTLSLKR